MKIRSVALFSCLFLLSACGYTSKDRVLSGAGIGAGAGLATSILLNTNPVATMAVGAAAGAITGGVTSHKKINLGKPLWK